jgi:hypothetical protein
MQHMNVQAVNVQQLTMETVWELVQALPKLVGEKVSDPPTDLC